MVAGQGGDQIGQQPIKSFAVKIIYHNKLLTDVQTRGRMAGLNGSGEMVQDAGTAVDNFAVILADRANGDKKGQYAIGGEMALVEVAATKTSSFGKPQVVGVGGMVQDRVAEAANKVCGMAMGKYDQWNNTTLQTNVSAGGFVLLYIKPWTIFT